jgi:hypothetical protein
MSLYTSKQNKQARCVKQCVFIFITFIDTMLSWKVAMIILFSSTTFDSHSIEQCVVFLIQLTHAFTCFELKLEEITSSNIIWWCFRIHHKSKHKLYRSRFCNRCVRRSNFVRKKLWWNWTNSILPAMLCWWAGACHQVPTIAVFLFA